MFEWIVNNLKAVLIFTAGVVFTVIVTRYKEGIKRCTNFVIDSFLSWVRIYFLILKRYKKSIIRSYRETKVGYRNLRLDLERNLYKGVEKNRGNKKRQKRGGRVLK